MVRPLIVVIGPTAVGKTELSVRLAEKLEKVEFLNADSRQMIRGLDIATCKPKVDELKGFPCHLLDLHEPGELYSVADWLVHARTVLAECDTRGSQPILVGGSGLYVTALIDGYTLSGVRPDPVRRTERNVLSTIPQGRAQLVDELRRRSPAAAAVTDLHNPRRVIRQLEILDSAGTSVPRREAGIDRPVVIVGIDSERELHRAMVTTRTTAHFTSGALLGEVATALQRGVPYETLATSGIGYREALAVAEGVLTEELAIPQIVQRTMRYAKAQRTWFRREKRAMWLMRTAGDSPGDLAGRAYEHVRP